MEMEWLEMAALAGTCERNRELMLDLGSDSMYILLGR